MTIATQRVPSPETCEIAPGVNLHVVRTRQFMTTVCRIVAHRPLDRDAATAAVLAKVMASATRTDPTRQALAEHLADLYGAGLHVGVGKLGDRHLLSATLEWPTAHIPDASRVLEDGLELLRDVWSQPLEAGTGLDPELVAAERTNLLRALASLRNDKAAFALRALVARACVGEPFARDARGTAAETAAVTPEAAKRLHSGLIRSAPLDVWIVGDVTLARARRLIRKHLLWPGRAARARRRPRAHGVRPGRARAHRNVLYDEVAQARLAFAWRGAVNPRSQAAAAALTLAGVLGGGAYGRLFKVVREAEGLCYDASAHFDRYKGMLVVETGVDPDDVQKATRSIRRLMREVANGQLDPAAHAAFLEDQTHRLGVLAESQGALIGWYQHAQALRMSSDPTEVLQGLRAVTPADVRRVGRRLKPEASVVLRPRGGG